MRLISFTTNLINLFVGTVLAILGLRFVLRLFGASDTAGFASWVYEMSGVLLEPFRGIFPTQTFDNQYVFEFTTIFAMIVYALLGMLLAAAVDSLTPTVSGKKKK